MISAIIQACRHFGCSPSRGVDIFVDAIGISTRGFIGTDMAVIRTTHVTDELTNENEIDGKRCLRPPLIKSCRAS